VKRFDIFDDHARAVEKDGPGLRRFDAARRPCEDRETQTLLKIENVLAERGLLDAELVRRLAETAGVRGGQGVAQQMDVDHSAPRYTARPVRVGRVTPAINRRRGARAYSKKWG